MVDACTSAGILPFYGPFGDIKDVLGCETQFRAAFLLGCVGAWSLHPVQIDIAKKVFSPPPDEVSFAKKVLEAIPDGAGVHMIDGKMQDDATWKQCKVMVTLAEMLAKKDPELAEAYEIKRVSEPFRHRLRVRYNECDPQGVVFNANYLTYFDLTMGELWRELGGYQAMVDAGVDMVVAEATIRYLAPLRFDDELELVAGSAARRYLDDDGVGDRGRRRARRRGGTQARLHRDRR